MVRQVTQILDNCTYLLKTAVEMNGVRTLTPEMVEEGVYPTAIHYVGRYTLQPVWSDGHLTGIFTFEMLREMWKQEPAE